MLQSYRTESCLLEHPEDIRQSWLDLQDIANCSYFISWGWIGTWLQQIAIECQPLVVRVWCGEQLVGLSIFVPRDIRRRIVFRAAALFLNEYPFEQGNMVIEYNGLLAAGHEAAVYSSTAGHLLRQYKQFDELHFSAVAEGTDLNSLTLAAGKQASFLINDESTAWLVDLSGLEAGLESYLATLSKNRRSQLRRSLRHYEEQGTLSLVEAHDTGQALEFFDALKLLHTQRHQLAGEGGAFANTRWEDFHRTLINERFSAGEIQLIRVAGPDMTIGYLYNFIWRGRVYVQQTGFSLARNSRELPGYVVHALAIVHNRDRGMTEYDLMHGDSLYKRILCNRSVRLYWGVLQRPRLKFSLEKLVVGLVRRCR